MTRSSTERGRRPVVFGEVLFDRFPDGSVVLGGAPFNVAWHLQAFDQAPLFLSRVGQDALGERVRSTMQSWGMDTSGLQTDATHPTGTVEVAFENGEPRYEIVPDRAYDFVEPAPASLFGDAALIYHGSLALRSALTREALAALLRDVPAPRFIDVNLRAPWWRREAVLEALAGAAWVKLNEHELAILDPAGRTDDGAAEELRQRNGLRGVILTRGAEGAVMLGTGAPILVAPGNATHVVDTVGAGDAFTSVVLLGLLRRWPLQSALDRAQEFASAIVGRRGATVDDPGFYERFRAWTT